MKIKVAEFIWTLQDGGAETLIKDYALKLDREKFDIIVIVVRRNPWTAVDQTLSNNNVKIISLYKNNSFLTRVMRKAFGKWYIPYKLSRVLNDEKIDVLHVHLRLLKYIFRIRKNIKNIKLLYTCHNEPETMLAGKSKIEGKAAKALIYENNMRVIALHDDMRKEINEMFGINNTVIIKNSIDFERFRNVKDTQEQIRKSLGIPKDAFVLGHIGRFHYQKNHDFLIDIFKETYDKNNKAFLFLIGDGGLMGDVKTKINKYGLKDHVLILSHRSDIPKLLKTMNIFVFPSRFEGLSVTLVEAQVSGVRCIVSNRVNKTGILSNNTVLLDIDAPAEKWAEIILDDSIKGQAYGNIEEYDMNKEIKKLEKLYEFDE